MAKGYSIHLGVKDYCIRGDLCRFSDKLPGALDAANYLRGIATAAGFVDASGTAPVVHRNNDATLGTLTTELQAAQGKLALGDFLVVTFAGYGIGHNASSMSAADRGWELYDKSLTYKELSHLLYSVITAEVYILGKL